MDTRSGEKVSAQVAIFDNVENLSKKNFKLDNGQAFVVKNEGTEPIELEVIPAGCENEKFVKTTFDPGWNPELIREIKMTSLSVKIKFGY